METMYQQDGYALFRQAIPPADLEPLRTCIMRQVDAHARQLLADGKISSLYEDAPFGQRLALLHQHNELRLRSWDAPVFGPKLHELIHHVGIANALEPYLGPNISFNGDYHLRPKMPQSEATAFPLHQDSQYYGKPSQHAHIITVWIPLVDVDEENGCLYVIPKSNHWTLFDSVRDENQNMRSFVDIKERGTPIPLPMQAGDILLFSNMTFHGSKINRTNAVRWSIDIRYCRTRGTYSASTLEQAGEDFMYEKLKKTKRIPMVVRGEGTHWSFEEWVAAREDSI
ncbi:MAG: phytanoyl-CoA dioxygenase family protein [Chloroflexota bacterium]